MKRASEKWIFSKENNPHIRKSQCSWQGEQQFTNFEDARQYAIKWAEEQIKDLQDDLEFWKKCTEEDYDNDKE